MGDTKKLISNSLIVFVGTIIGSVFAYLFNMLMGRMLGPAQYGEMTAVMSLLMITSVGGGAILTVVMKYSGEIYHSGSSASLIKLIKVFSKFVFFLGMICLLIGLALAKPISSFFRIEHLTPVIIAFLSFIFGFMILVNKGVLQGTQRFIALSLVGILETGLRLIIGIALVKIGLGVGGAISAIVLATAIAYIFTFWPIARVIKENKKNKEGGLFQFNKKEILSYTWPTTITMFLLMLALNVDIIFIKHLFPSGDAGIYAAISTIGKIILYGTAPVVAVMFPMISERKIKGDKHYIVFIFSLILTILGGLVILGIFSVAPSKVIALLYGSQYIGFYYLLPEVGLFILFYTLVNLISNYFLAVKDFVFLWMFIPVLLAQVVIILLWHPSIVVVVRILIMTLGLLFGLLMSYYLYTKREQIKLMFRGENGE